MSLPLIRKLGRDWHVKAGFADVHPLTQIHNRPVGQPPAGCVCVNTRPP